MFVLVEVHVVGFDGAKPELSEDRLDDRVGRLKLDRGPGVALPEVLELVRGLEPVQGRLVEVVQLLDLLDQTVLPIENSNEAN